LWYGIASTRSLDRSSAFMGGILYEGEGGEPTKARIRGRLPACSNRGSGPPSGAKEAANLGGLAAES
jgi:hypothetical protein